MKKIFALALVLALALNMVACGGGAPKADAPAKSPEAPAATAEPAPTKAPDPTEGYPRGYTPKYTQKDAYSAETNAGGNKDVTQTRIGTFFNKAEPTVVEYSELSRKLESIYKGTEIVWPELNDDWKGWGYTSIVNSPEGSVRTMEAGKYMQDQKYFTVTQEHDAALRAIIGEYTSVDTDKTPAGLTRVPYTYMESKKSLTPKELAGAAYEVLYLQTWYLVPMADQGVLIKTPDGSYTGEMIVEMNK
ncbi:MAG: hypothetical protein RR827_08900 [Oscillospiraceae bacterium]